VFQKADKFCGDLIPILLSVGQGTRLCSDTPKALLKVKDKPLIEYFIQKIHQASLVLNRPLSAIMIVSEQSYAPIKDFLESQNYLGLLPSQLHLIIQDQLPFMTDKDEFVLKDESHLFYGPSGNGGVFELLKKEGFFDDPDFKPCGFEIIPIDNPLAPLFSQEHKISFDQGYEASVIAVDILDHTQKLGRLAKSNNKMSIIEYSETPPEYLDLGNTGLLAFSYGFAKKQSAHDLPLHIAYKDYKCFTGTGYETVRVKKFETFIFDHLECATSTRIIKAKASDVFQPLKEKQGPFGLEALENALAVTEISAMLKEKGAL
jgi:UDP-N-acetylglucosamine pyrophosphorylase